MLRKLMALGALFAIAACGSSGGLTGTVHAMQSATQVGEACVVGQKVDYRRGQTFHVEGFMAENRPVVQDILHNRDNPVMREKKKMRAAQGLPASYKEVNVGSRAYDIFDAAVVPQFSHLGVKFYRDDPNGVVFDVVFHDIDPALAGPIAILDKHDRCIGTVVARPHGARSIIVENLRMVEAAPLVLPKTGWGKKAAVTYNAKTGCKIMNPGSDGRSLTVALHRIDNKNPVRPGQLVSIVCERPEAL